MRYRGFRRALLRSLRGFMAEDFSVLYGGLGLKGIPTLLFWGRHDQTVPFIHSGSTAEALGARLVVVEKAGHTPHLEKPEIFESEILRFLTRDGPD
jgi:pimeloyl-ACP methyl ester carboxylesterase